MSRTRIFWIILGIVVLAVGLRSFHITARSLWFDEAFSWKLIQFPLKEMIARDSIDVHPPLYYVLLQNWTYVFGSSILAIRLFSVACAGLSLVGAYLYSAYAFRSKRAGVYSALFLAISPWVVSYGWEARMYPLGMVFALFSSFALLHAVRDKSLGWFSAYGVLAVALAYTHYYGFFTIFAQIVFVLVVLVTSTKWRIGEMVQSRIFWGGILSFCISFALFSPWLPMFLQQRSQVQESFWIPPVTFSAVADTFYQIPVPTLHIPRMFGVYLLPFILVILVSLYALLRYRRVDGVWLTLLLAFIPLVSSILISLGGRSLYNDRFFAFAGIFLFILIAFLVSSLKKPLIRKLVFACVLLGLTFTFVQYWNELNIVHKGGSHAATKYVFMHRKNGEQVLVSSPYVYFAILYYAEEEFDDSEKVRLYSKTGEISHFSGKPILTQRDIVGPKDIAEYKNTVWVVDTTGFTEKPFQAPSNWQEESREVFPEVFVHQGDVIVRKFTVHL